MDCDITRIAQASCIAALALIGCAKEQGAPSGPEASSTAAAPESAATPAPATAAATSAPTSKPSHACPDGSTGQGTFKSPCEAKGPSRLMEVTWTGKMGDAGPSFRVVNNAKLEVLYGNVAAYFYDKAGKQLQVPAGGASTKPRPKQTCGGGIFAGPMKPGEKAVLYFSCVKKEHVPEGTVAIEAEIQMVGFTASGGGKADTYWRNNDLVPDVRPKGGVK